MSKKFKGRERDYRIRAVEKVAEECRNKVEAFGRILETNLVAQSDRIDEIRNELEQVMRESATIHAALCLAVAGSWSERQAIRKALRRDMLPMLEAARQQWIDAVCEEDPR